MLSAWTVPADLATELAAVAQEIDQALEGALTSTEVTADDDE